MKYLLSFLLFLVAVIGIIIGIIVVRNALSGVTTNVPAHVVSLHQYDKATTTFRLREIGPIVAEENHREIEITVSADGRHAEIDHGYNQSVDNSVDYDNNSAAYSEFIAALNQTSWRLVPDNKPADWQGQCASGRRYQLDVLENDKVVRTGWATSCASTSHLNPAMGDYLAISQLFKNQIPDFNKLAVGSGL